jgi:hypothetical protein
MALDQLFHHFEARFERSWGRPSWWNLLIVLPWVAVAILCFWGFGEDHRVAAREQTTQGVIDWHEPSNHDRYEYRFTIRGKRYTGWASPTTAEFEMGQKVVVYYDPLDPNNSALVDFADAGDRELGPVSFCVIGITAVVLLVFIRRRATRTNAALPRNTA